MRGAERAAAELSYGHVRSYEFLGAISLDVSDAVTRHGDRSSDRSEITSPSPRSTPRVASYRRDLDLETAVASLRFQSPRDGGVASAADAAGAADTAGAVGAMGGGGAVCEYGRHAFVSSSDDVVVLRLNSSCAFDAN